MLGVVGEFGRNAEDPAQRPGVELSAVGVPESPVQDGGNVVGVVEVAHIDRRFQMLQSGGRRSGAECEHRETLAQSGPRVEGGQTRV
ncbi:Uncharacterised protein [Mycobacteroides abscessus subsp. abscessus]|nr:Uncharacterised protein [Mycobacteroides abscessus subsp. abscessus]SKW97031.1 Uncharacterised protein [Mycobacteroides abscessus subsp. abscessus]